MLIKHYIPAILISVICGVTALAWPAESYAERSYPMVCRGGGSMQANVFNAKYATTRIYFNKARTGANSRPPGTGECAWLDRPINADEPDSLSFVENSNPVTQIIVNASGTQIRWNERAKITDILKKIQRGEIFNVHAANSRRGFFKVTRLGP